MAQELGSYGVTANAIAPGALTRLTEGLTPKGQAPPNFEPRWVAPVVTWLASEQSGDVTGQVIESSGRLFAVAEGWHRGPAVADAPSEAEEVESLLRKLLADARPRTTMTEAL